MDTIGDSFETTPPPYGPPNPSNCKQCGAVHNTVWNPFRGEWMDKGICDDCLEEREREQRQQEWDETFEQRYDRVGLTRLQRRNIKQLDKIHPWLERWVTKCHPQDVESHWGIYLHGGVGTGKTTQAGAAARRFLEYWVAEQHRHVSARFAHVVNLLEQEKESYGSKKVDPPDWHALKTCDLLILDDVGQERGTDFSGEKIASLIEHRYSEMKLTCFVSNVSLNDLSPDTDIDGSVSVKHSNYGERVTSRIYEMIGGTTEGRLAELEFTTKYRTGGSS
jgi:primosomal protein DnaI